MGKSGLMLFIAKIPQDQAGILWENHDFRKNQLAAGAPPLPFSFNLASM